jgi:DNA-binding NtrC family response regulator
MSESSSLQVVLWIDSDGERSPAFEDVEHCRDLRVVFAREIPDALEILRDQAVQAILIHLPFAASKARDVLSEIRQHSGETPVILYEPDGCLANGAALIRGGAFHCVSQPATIEQLCEVLWIAIRERQEKAISAAPALPSTRSVDGWRSLLVGSSTAMRDVVEIIRMVAKRRSTVLITGETGTGKEVVARAIHMASGRTSARMVAVNCAALPDHLLEAELFGHTKGAFTGAVSARVGLFEQAHRGTILLDEISEMPLQLQSKLLRVLQEREVQRIGSSEPTPVDVRVIAASNANLAEAVAQRRFREDLYYRLNVVALKLPPLRERASDIPDLVQHFLEKIAQVESTSAKQVSSVALETLMRYHWPGNVRQLEHAVESAVALTDGHATLHPGDFDLPAEGMYADFGGLSSLDIPETGLNFDQLIMGIERRLLEQALLKSGGNKARAANMLNMKRTTLISKFKSLEVCA